MKFLEKINFEYFQTKQNTLSDLMISPPKFCIKTESNFKDHNINLNLICCKEQILFGLLRMQNLEYHIRDNEKRLIDFIYGKHMHEQIKELNAELILTPKTIDSFDYEHNFKEHKEEICKFYKIDSKLSNEQIRNTILEQINLSFLK
jgi:hypothetical protein